MDIGRTIPADVGGDLLAEVLSYKSLYEALSRLVQDAVIQLDAAARIVRWNLAAEALTGYSAQRCLGKPFRELLANNQLQIILDIPCDGVAHEIRFSFLDPAGFRTDVRAYVTALRNGEESDGWLVTCMSARHADEIEQLKNEFVSTVSHELKTPLAAIKAYCSTLLLNPGLDEEARVEYLSVVDQQTDRLNRLIDDLLLVTRVEAGQMLKRRVRLSLDTILERVVGDLLYDGSVHRIELETNGVKVSGDPDRIVDVLTHILDNAIKYTPGGGTVRVAAREQDGHTVIDIRDEGIGIHEEHLPLIFDRFYRVDSELTSNVGGSGLGLFLVHSLVRAHGGKVDVRSEPGKGSTFTLKMPVRE
ncbi:MAG: PAS domain-containing protein [Candidatus Eremiobacteraeota bacterium]|nr:PAS domain-containing protein [Candidatus Eremiobacteraeota bacterium]